jgi:hypothetical protein
MPHRPGLADQTRIVDRSAPYAFVAVIGRDQNIIVFRDSDVNKAKLLLDLPTLQPAKRPPAAVSIPMTSDFWHRLRPEAIIIRA